MPLIELTLPATDDHGDTTQLVSELTEIVLSCEGAPPESIAARELTWCLVNRPLAVYVAGSRSAPDRYVVRITLPEGLLAPDGRVRLIRESTQAIAAYDGRPDAGYRTACLIVEVPDGRFGWAGEVVTRRALAALVSGPSGMPGTDAWHPGQASTVSD